MASAQRPPAAPDRKKLSAVGAIDNNQTDPNSQSHYKDNPTIDNVIAIVGSVLGVLSFIVGFIFSVVKIKVLTKKLKEHKKANVNKDRKIEELKRANENKEREIEEQKRSNEILEQHIKRNEVQYHQLFSSS